MSIKNKKYDFLQEDVEFVYNLLRQGSIIWSGRAECLRRARKKVFVRRAKKTGKPVYKLHWKCAHCQKWYRDVNNMEVDHIVEIGGVSAFKGDWNEMIAKVLPRPVDKHLQCLCITCHLKKTKRYNNASSLWKRRKK